MITHIELAKSMPTASRAEARSGWSAGRQPFVRPHFRILQNSLKEFGAAATYNGAVRRGGAVMTTAYRSEEFGALCSGRDPFASHAT
jgi:hypothetical protein